MESLVTVIISTYNSAPFIIETLESVLKQSWENIELIITDDCSTDNTVEICIKWLNNNHIRFTDAKILTSEKNTGVSANANRGLQVAKGKWIKFLGADDALKINCLEDNMKWIISHPDIKVLFSRIEVYKDTFVSQNLLKTIPGEPLNAGSIMAHGRNADSQYRMLLVCDRIHYTPSVFLHRETLLKAGGFDERFRMLEDYPLWLKLTKLGFRLSFMDRITVNYRQHSNAINNTGILNIVNPNYFRTEFFRRIYTYPFLPFLFRMDQRYKWVVLQIFRGNRINRNKILNKALHDLLTVYMNPFRYIIWVRKRFDKSLQNNEFYM